MIFGSFAAVGNSSRMAEHFLLERIFSTGFCATLQRILIVSSPEKAVFWNIDGRMDLSSVFFPSLLAGGLLDSTGLRFRGRSMDT
jgi:hypothetical protein